MVVLAAQVIVGGVLSLTDTLLLQVAVLPQSSVARYVRVNILGQVPSVVSPRKVTSTVWSQASLAVTVGQEGVFGQSMVVLAAQVMVGGVLSVNVKLLLHVAVLPQSSDAR
jgi:hypothetical protein